MDEPNVYNILHQKFQYIVVLTMSHRRDRQKLIDAQLMNIGYNMSYGGIKKWYATSFPHNDIIAAAFNTTNRGRFTKPGEYDCARNHYAIVKTAYDLGYENVLIMEDDIRFNKNSDLFKCYLNNIPGNFDILQFGGFSADPLVKETIKEEMDKGTLWYHNTKLQLWNCSMYALSRKGMEYYIKFMDKVFWVADGPLYKAPLNHKIINTYIPVMPLVIQYDKDEVISDIRNKSNDQIDYNNMNMYEYYVSKDQDYYL